MKHMNINLDNGRVRVEIETEHGCIVRFEHGPLAINLIQEPRLAENFRLLLPLPHWRGHYVLGKDQQLSDWSTEGSVCRLTWNGLTSEAGEFDIMVTQTIRLEGDDVTFSVDITNQSPYVIEEVFTMALGGIANPAERLDWRLHFAQGNGQGHEWTFFEAFPGTYLGPAHPVWTAMYHGELSMPWIDLYHHGERKGVYVGNHDTKIRQSCVWMQLYPSTVYGGSDWEQFWPHPATTGDHPVGVTLAWNNFPFIAPAEQWAGPPIVFHFHSGTWWAAADYFRAWYDAHWAIDKAGSWLAEADAWQSTIISYPEGTIGFRFCDLPQMARDALSYGIRVLQIDGWDVGGIDRDYPYYTPDPRLGTWTELEAALSECAALGVKVLLFSNLQWINLETEWYQRELHRYAVRDPFGNLRNAMGWEYNTTLGLRNQTICRMVVANPSRPEFQQIILEQLQNIVRLGAAGTQIDKLGGMADIDYAADSPAPRDTAIPQGIVETLQAYFHQATQADPQFRLASEVHWDRAVPFIDASYSRFFSRDHLPTFGHTFPEYRQSCCITGDWDFGLVNNCLRFGHIINVEGRCLHGTAAAVPTLSRYVAEALRTRRVLWDVLWRSTLVEPTLVDVTGPPEVLYGLHQSWDGPRQALVLNHFERRDPRVTINHRQGVAAARIFRPFQEPSAISLPAELVVVPDEFCIVVFDG
jgi:hypothetical protein